MPYSGEEKDPLVEAHLFLLLEVLKRWGLLSTYLIKHFLV
jgi:hypothetical protein